MPESFSDRESMTGADAKYQHHRRIAVFVSPESNHAPSERAWAWAQSDMIRSGDCVVLVTVIPNFTDNLIAPAMGRLGSVAVAIEVETMERQRKELYANAERVLLAYRESAKCDGWTLHTRILNQTASSVAETLVEWANKHSAEEVIVGTREIGGFKGIMMALVGKGSVSKHLVNHIHCPVVVVKDSH